MKRSNFLLIIAIVTTLFGAMMLFAPPKVAETFGLTRNPELSIILRMLGAIILASAILNFLVRNSSDANTMTPVLIFNFVTHAVTLVVVFMGIAEGVVEVSKFVPGIVVHSFISIGSVVYLIKMKATIT